MKLTRLLKELEETEQYKKFKQENPSSFFAAAFLIRDLESKNDKIQLDYFLSDKKKIASFEHPFNEPKIHEDEIKEMTPQSTEIKIDIDDLEKEAKRQIIDSGSRLVPTKIIAILKDDLWNITCMDNMLGIVQIKLSAKTGKQNSIKKDSLTDFIKIKKPDK